MYNINFDQIYKDYYYNKNRINRNNDYYIMDAIEYTPQLRDALELLINTTLVQDNLMTEEQDQEKQKNNIQ